MSIAKKLALLLVAPVLALLVLTAIGVLGSLADSSDASDAEQRVAMSARTGELFEAARQESARNQLAVFTTNLDMDDVRAATDAATVAWLNEVSPYQSADTAQLIDYLQDFGTHRTQITAQYGTDVDGAIVVSDLDTSFLERIAAFDARIAGLAESSVAGELSTASQLTDAALSSATAEFLGLQATADGGAISSALAGAISTADADLLAVSSRTGQLIANADLDALNEELGAATVGDDVTIDQSSWLDASESRAVAIATARSSLLATTASEAAATSSDASSTMRNTALIGLAGILLGGLAMMFVGGMMRRVMGDLTVEAAAVAQHDVPALAEALSRGESVSDKGEERPFLEVEGSDEFAELGQSLNEIRRSTQSVAEEQGQLVQSGIAEMFVSLARRNQTLVDRQLEVIDELEAQEVDADRLSQVYRVDHLATRMRRNAESLLVLAGNSSPRKRGPAVDIREVVRVAIGEVEDYRRIIPIALDETPVAGHAAQDLAHLLSELMENATQSSPPGTVADVVGALEPDGSYSVSVIDRGTGIDATKRAELNVLLAKPPKNTLSGSMTMGLTVVARLAQRVGVTVQLLENESNGILAKVVLPAELVAEWGGGRPEVQPDVPVFGAVSTGVPGSPMSTPQAPESVELQVPDADKPLFEPFDFGSDAPEEPAAALDVPDVPEIDDLPTPSLDLPPIPDVPAPPTFDPIDQPVLDVPPVPQGGAFDTDVPTLDSGLFEPMDVMEPFELPSLDPAFLEPIEAPEGSASVDAPVDSESPFDTLTPPGDESLPEPPVFDSAPSFEVPDEPVFDSAPSFEVPGEPVFDSAPSFEVLPEPPVFEELPEPPVFAPTPDVDPTPADQSEPSAFEPEAPAATFEPPTAAPVPETAAPEPVGVGTGEDASSGRLTRRRRSAATSTDNGPQLDADRTAPSKRSPDQVKNMLSRYKTGLEKGRSTDQDGGS